MAKAEYKSFDAEGFSTGGGSLFLPDFLDWMPIRAKTFWFLTRGLGDPRSKYVLFSSQGEQHLCVVETPLQHLNHHQLKDIDNGIEELVWEYCARNGISRTPRNQ